jgi:uncharacterized DUF497 family protein
LNGVRIEGLLWDDENTDHVAALGVDPKEVWEAFPRRPKVRRAREGRYQAAGTTEAGRYLVVYYRYLGNNLARPITARDMNARERRAYAKK